MGECPLDGLPGDPGIVEVVVNRDAVPGDAISTAAEVTARLDEVYEIEPSALEPDVRNAQRRTMARNPW